MAAADLPESATATVTVLCTGYAALPRVAGTVSLISDDDIRVIVDPGMVADRRLILGPLRDLGVEPDTVTDIVFSHHHPDHTVNAALFPHARIHDFWAIYQDDQWVMRPADGFLVSASVRLLHTPGHSPQDITTVVGTAAGTVAFTHLWWTAEGPADDPFASDPLALRLGRERVLEIADTVVPGHGAPFVPSATTPR
jgi:glyoxylase-like metal-dependent hydrolase (beta-lactamase superfamily II)